MLLVFIDGVGIGPDDPAVNPLAAAALPRIRALLGGAGPFAGARATGGRGVLVGLDATLGVAGMPQSGTGHVALLTGENAAATFGRHFGPWVPTPLRPLLAERSVFARAARGGRRAAFANAYPEEVHEQYERAGRRIRGATPLRIGFAYAALEAGLLTRGTPQLVAGEAVASEIVNDGWILRLGRRDVPRVGAAEAGANLARIATAHELTVFAHYATDHVGHRGSWDEAVAAVERVDAFVGGVVDALPPDATLIVVSDHGNLEDARAEHTLNPALCIVAGPQRHEVAARLSSLTDVAPALLRLLHLDRAGDGFAAIPAAGQLPDS